MGCFWIESPLWFWLAFLYTVVTAVSLFATGCWMLYSSKVLKPRIARQMIEDLHLQGGEKLLDLGCGRGLFLIESAKQLLRGNAHGIDLWQTQDQSGNRIETTLENARLENVAVEIKTGDMRSLPFPDDYFNVVISSLAIHNIPTEKGRRAALSEMLRVLAPGGKFALLDIQYGPKYAKFLIGNGAKEVVCSRPSRFYCPPIRMITGKKDAD